ncbi:B-cell CLL/lymphoma 6 member B protein isoform X2 [Amia ocellicauda]
MDETLQENKTLKLQLEVSERELKLLKACMGDGRRGSPSHGAARRPPPRSHGSSRQRAGPLRKPARGLPAASLPNGYAGKEAPRPQRRRAPETRHRGRPEVVAEIDEEGRLCTHEVDVEEHLELSAGGGETDEEQSGSPERASGRTPPEPGSSQVTDPHFHDPHLDYVVIKEEGPELDPPRAGTCGAAEDRSTQTGLAIAQLQSQLLEEWRPEPLHPTGSDTETLIPSTSHSLALPEAFFQPPDTLPMTSDPPGDAHAPERDLPPEPGAPHFPLAYPGGTPGPSPAGSQEAWPAPGGSLRPGKEDGYPCKVCGERFRLPSDLRKHRPVHVGQRSQYHCQQCGKDFNRLENLKTHQRIHTGERPYCCSECGVRFRHSGALKRHFRIHTGEKPYACPHCHKAFRNCGGLKFHMRVHLREAPHHLAYAPEDGVPAVGDPSLG